MKKMGTLIRLIVSILFAAGMFACTPSIDVEGEKAAVRAAWDDLSRAFEAKDWDRYAQFWVQDADLQVVHPSMGDWIKGWDAFQQRYKAIVASDAEWASETRRFEVQISQEGDAAWAVIEIVLTMNGTEQTMWEVAVFKKIQDQWKLSLGFAAPVTPDPDLYKM
jgi:ketosteroid isomerase-like protein